MVFKVKRGGNYGWSVMEGPQPVNVEARRGPAPILPPIKAHPHSEAASITGGYVYHGTRLPELTGAYHLRRLLVRNHLGPSGPGRDGHLAAGVRPHAVASGRLRRSPRRRALPSRPRPHAPDLSPGRQSARKGRRTTFRGRLSQTGLFASTRDHQPAPGRGPLLGQRPALVRRCDCREVAGCSGRRAYRLDNQGVWRFPTARFSSELSRSSVSRETPASRRRMETQILHLEADIWRPYSYVWNDDQTDAVPRRARRRDQDDRPEGAGRRARVNYRVHARTECGCVIIPGSRKRTTVFGVQSASPLGSKRPN